VIPSSITARGALGGAAFAFLWVVWGVGAALFVLLAALIGAVVAGTVAGELDPVRAVRELQDRP
jgi:hypothetical protein